MTSDQLEAYTYATITHVAETATDRDLSAMLNRVTRTIPHLEKSKLYQTVQRDMRTNKCAIVNQLEHLVSDGFGPTIEPHLMVWLIGLRTAVEMKNFDALHIQLSMFIIGQKENILRIEDDKTRLITTYIHFSIAGHLLNTATIT